MTTITGTYAGNSGHNVGNGDQTNLAHVSHVPLGRFTLKICSQNMPIPHRKCTSLFPPNSLWVLSVLPFKTFSLLFVPFFQSFSVRFYVPHFSICFLFVNIMECCFSCPWLDLLTTGVLSVIFMKFSTLHRFCDNVPDTSPSCGWFDGKMLLDGQGTAVMSRVEVGVEVLDIWMEQSYSSIITVAD